MYFKHFVAFGNRMESHILYLALVMEIYGIAKSVTTELTIYNIAFLQEILWFVFETANIQTGRGVPSITQTALCYIHIHWSRAPYYMLNKMYIFGYFKAVCVCVCVLHQHIPSEVDMEKRNVCKDLCRLN